MPVTGTPTAARGTANTLTFAYISDSNPLYVFVSTHQSGIHAGVTYGGVPLTQGGSATPHASNGVASDPISWWRLAAPVAGSADVVVSAPGADARGVSAYAVNLSGWPASISLHLFSSEAGRQDLTHPSKTVVSRVGAEVIDWLSYNDALQNTTAGAGQTELVSQDGGSGSLDQRIAGSIKDGAPSVTMAWGMNIGADYWSHGELTFVAVESDPIPNSTPLAAQTPCTPQATVGNGGKGKAGCNVGGVGGGHQYDLADGLGSVPQHDDPDDGETLTGAPGAVLEAWIELDHVDYPSDDVTTYRRSFEELADDSDYEGGRKEAGLLSIAEIEHGLGNEQGGFEAATVEIKLSDIRDKLFRTLADDQELDGDQLRIKGATDAARAAHTVPRTFIRAVVQQMALESFLLAGLTAVDWLFSDFGPFGPNRKDPNWTFNDLGGAAPDMTSDTKAQAIPLLYFEKSDENAVDPLTTLPASKGLLPGFYLGMFDLAGSLLPSIPDTPGRTLEALIAIMEQLVADGVPPVSWVDTIGFDLGTDDITIMLAKTGNTIPTTFEALASYLGGEDVKEALKQGTTPAPTDTKYGFVATGLGPWYAYPGVYGSNLGGGDPQQTHDRVKLDPRSRSDILVPGINWPFANPYFELTNPDTGRTFWLTGVFVRGPLLDDHLNGVVTLAFNAIGIEENGDGSGLPIARIEDAKQHRLENHWINRWSSGPYADDLTFPMFNDGVPMVRSSSFTTRQNYFKQQLGDEGLLAGGWYTATQQANLDIVRQWNRETESRLGVNQHGQIMDWGLDETVDPSTWPRLFHDLDVHGAITRTAGQERENLVVGSCDFDPDFEKYRVGPIQFQSAAGVQKYKGRIKQGDVIESQMLDNPTHFSWLLQRRLKRLEFGTTLLEVPGPLDPWANYDVGRGVLFNSEDGPGANGYVDHPHVILRRKVDLANRLITFTLWDVRDLLADTSELLDIVYASFGGEAIRSSDTSELVYASQAA